MAKTTPNTTALVPVETPSLKVINGHGWVTSQQVAERFGKLHRDVLRAIRGLACSPEFMLRNFAQHEYEDGRGNAQPVYEMTRDGFLILAMGFTGPQAMAWKEAFIAAFNQLEQAHIARLEEKAEAALQVRQTREALLQVPWSEQLIHRHEGLRLLDQIKAERDPHRRQHHYVTLQRFNALQGEDTPRLDELAPPTLFIENGPSRQDLLEQVEELGRVRDLLLAALRGMAATAVQRLVSEGSEQMPEELRAAVQAIKVAQAQKGGAA